MEVETCAEFVVVQQRSQVKQGSKHRLVQSVEMSQNMLVIRQMRTLISFVRTKFMCVVFAVTHTRMLATSENIHASIKGHGHLNVMSVGRNFIKVEA
jgi:hypothetical protein